MEMNPSLSQMLVVTNPTNPYTPPRLAPQTKSSKFGTMKTIHGCSMMHGGWGHDCSILKVSWAHPEFGNVLASCSLDRTVKIWEEQEHGLKGSGRRWKLMATLPDHKGSVQDIEFAPSHLGLKIATCSADGFVRIYEAMDVINLSAWDLVGQFEVLPGAKESDHLCLSWCPSRFQSEMLVVGCGKDNVAKVIYKQDEDKQWKVIETLVGHSDIVTDVSWAPNLGRSYQLIATSSKDKGVRIFKLCDEDQLGTNAPVGGSFGLDMPRGVSQPSGLVGQPPQGGGRRGGKLRLQSTANLGKHEAEVWRVDWNITGTVLSSSGDDGKIRLWGRKFTGDSKAVDEWKLRSVISAEAPPENL
ncbi:epoxide hydrolase, soluble (sEH) [Dinochytrium kinnereticum]|nr:epoxide hydrolase, soluble (sEH) [Dinochytrium kinnereticum]